MKRSQEDSQIVRLLKEQSRPVSENPWFTPRVLNRLPKSPRSTRWVWALICLVAGVLCLGCWLWLLRGQDVTVFTIRDLYHFIIMSAITLAVLWQGIVVALPRY